MYTKISAIIVTTILLTGCGQVKENPYDATQLIPREVLFGNPDKIMARLSPDGQRIAYLAPVDGVMNIWVGPVDQPEAARPMTAEKKRGLRRYFWAYTSEHIIYMQDKDGDENWRIYSVNVINEETRLLTPAEKVNARVQEVSYLHPETILAGLNDRDPQFHDLYTLNILTGEKSLVLQNEGFADFVTDDHLAVRFAVRMTEDGGQEILQRTDDDWKLFASISAEDAMTTGIEGFNKTGEVAYMLDSRERDTAALLAVNLQTGDKKLLAEHPKADIAGAMLHPTEKTLQAVIADYLRQEWQFFDPQVEADVTFMSQLADGEVQVVSRSQDDRQWLVAMVMDDGPVQYHHLNRDTQKATFLFSSRKDLENLPLANMHPLIIRARDGLDLVSYLTLPVGTDLNDDHQPTAPLPMVLLVHGGPWARDNWGYSAYHQWLANRGYAVLSVNYRGSLGFGKRYSNAAIKEWGGKMHDDLIDAVNWAIEEKIADPDRVAIMGGSYGGYATLVGLTFTPTVFACGVDIVGPSNLITLLESIPPYWKPVLNMFTYRVGDFRTEEGRAFLESRSPLTYVDRIERPLLIGQGANDPRVKQAEADQIVKAMEEKNIPVVYVLYPDEGHGFARPENRMSFNAITELFLQKNLGGRSEPIGDDFQGAALTVPAGAGQIEGLKEALSEKK